MENLQIDNLDKQILEILMTDARTPFLEVARKCGVSGATIHQRVKSLERRGIIKGTCYEVDPRKLGYRTCAYIGIYLEEARLFSQVVKHLRSIPEITQCHYTTGVYSIFIKVYTRDNEHLKQVLSDKLQAIPGIARTETFISLEESFARQVAIPGS
ncbi:MAG TPA: AsnC family transcriptional regulator [Bacteroidetes bacterium]|nr:AsnC family transcriptional regulator [Bacteroidota bacterium]